MKRTSEMASYHICKLHSDRRHCRDKSTIFLNNTKERIRKSKIMKSGQNFCEEMFKTVLESPEIDPDKQRSEGTPL